MKNLQLYHIYLVQHLLRNKLSDQDINIVKNILREKSFISNFKNELSIYKAIKNDQGADVLIEKIINTSTTSILPLITEAENPIAKNIRGVLVYSYLRQLNGFTVSINNRRAIIKEKKKILNKLKAHINQSQYRVALYVWGSYIMKAHKLSIFSDLDLVLVIDDSKLLGNKVLKRFLRELFIDIDYYNLPSDKEISRLKYCGLARCGFIQHGQFINFKIITKSSLQTCLEIFADSLYQKGNRCLLIPGFDGSKLSYSKQNRISAYPIVRQSGVFTLGRGLLAEFFHTAQMFACSDVNLKNQLIRIQARAIMKGLRLLRYFSDSRSSSLLDISYTPKETLNHSYAKTLLNLYSSLDRSQIVYRPYLLLYIYIKVVLPLKLECPRRYWTPKNLTAFFLGSPGQVKANDKKSRDMAFKSYFKKIDEVYEKLNLAEIEENLDILLRWIHNGTFQDELQTIKNQLGIGNSVLLFTAFCDLIENIPERRSDFHIIREAVFQTIFKREYVQVERALYQLNKCLNNGRVVRSFKKRVERDILEKASIFEITLRLRKPASIFHHHLMKKIPLNAIDDMVSLQVCYKAKNAFDDVCTVLEEELTKILIKLFKKKMLQIGKYRGCHFYFLFNNVPFEIMIRDLRSDLSALEKVKHSIAQKRHARLE